MNRRNLLKALSATCAVMALSIQASRAVPLPSISWLGKTEEHPLAEEVRALFDSLLTTGILKAKLGYFDYDIAVTKPSLTVRYGRDFCLMHGYTDEGIDQGLEISVYDEVTRESYVIGTFNTYAWRGTPLGRSMLNIPSSGLMLPKIDRVKFERLISEGKAKLNLTWLLKAVNASKDLKISSRNEQQVSAMAAAYSGVPNHTELTA